VSLKVKNNIKKNRLYFIFSGKPTKEEMDRLYTDVRFNVSDLKNCFDVISDFSECKIVYLNGIKTFIKIMNYLFVNGVGEVVRVINENSLLFIQVRNLSNRVYGYSTRYVSTFEEAERELDLLNKRNGTRINVNGMPVTYKKNCLNIITGKIENLSTSGCAIESGEMDVVIGEIISMEIEFKNEAITTEKFKVKGQVVRVDGRTFAVKFEEFEKDEKDRLWKRLILECQSEI